jgi:ABC-type branched-subunit amino acid transport system ATPase component
MPEVYQIQFPNLIAFDEYWYLTTREALYIVDKETEETQEFGGDSKDLKQIMEMFKGRLKVIKGVKPTVRRTIIINDKVLLDEPNPYKLDRYPIVPVLAYFTPDTPYYAYKFKGVVRDLRDAQYLFNRRKVTDLDILESQQQGLKIKKGSLVTPDDSMNTGNGRVLVVDPKFQLSDVEQMAIIPPSPVMLEMETMLQDVMNRISGVNETMLGADINDKAGIISMLRNSAGITTLTRLFDQFDEAQRLSGDIDIEMVQKNYTWGKIRQIIGEDPTSEFDDKAFLKYGCKIVQGAMTETQQQLQLQQLLYFRETTQIPIPPRVIIEASTLQNKDELIKAIEEEQQAQAQQQQQMSQLEMEKMKVDNATKMGYAHSQNALASERMAKIQTDLAVAEDKLKRANQEDTHSLLNLIKGIKELEGMDIQHLEKKLNILMSVSSVNQANQEKINQETKEVSHV